MPRRALWLALPLLLGWGHAKPSARYPSADPTAVVRFHHHYDPYFRALFGCPFTATDPAQCRPAAGWVDTEDWRQAREDAKTVFQLREP